MVANLRAKIPATEAKTSRFVEKQLPTVFKEVDSLMIPFLEAYYAWMEQEGGITNDIKSLIDYQDYRKAPDRFMKFFMEEFLPGIPADVLADKRLLLQHAKQFYRSRGSEASFKFLFRILFNEDVEIYYPKVDIFRTSDAKWVVRNVIKVADFDEQIAQLVNRKIYGVDSAATALVESVTTQIVGSENIAYIVISSRYGNFLIDEAITTTSENDEIPVIYARILGTVSGANITARGTGYSTGENIPILDNGDGSGIYATVDTVDINGGIIKIRINDGGVDYIATPPTPDIASMSGTGAEFTFNIAGNFNEVGYFTDDSCQTSSTKRLQDGKLYQDFSYVLKTNVPIEKFRDVVKRLVHPAGFYMASEAMPPSLSIVDLFFHPLHRLTEDVDTTYPDGLPGEVSFLRLYYPSSMEILPTSEGTTIEIIPFP